jgi:hypothetical protein
MNGALASANTSGLGIAWVALCLALTAHIVDEAVTGFLSVYNPTVLELRKRFPWLPFPVFRFGVWLTGLILANSVLFALSPFAFRNAAWLRPLAYFFAVVMFGNGVLHTVGTIRGRSVASLPFKRPMPGFLSSPLLLAASLYLLFELHASGRPQ